MPRQCGKGKRIKIVVSFLRKLRSKKKFLKKYFCIKLYHFFRTAPSTRGAQFFYGYVGRRKRFHCGRRKIITIIDNKSMFVHKLN